MTNLLPLEAFTDRQPEMVALLRELVEMETPSTDKAALDAFGRRLGRYFYDTGAEVAVVQQPVAGDHLLCRWGGAGSGGILVLCHMDTVYPRGTLAQRPFREEDGRIYAPGALDMKAGIVEILTVLRVFKETGRRPTLPPAARPVDDRLQGDRPLAIRPVDDRLQGDRPLAIRPADDRLQGDRPLAIRPADDPLQKDRPLAIRPADDPLQKDRPLAILFSSDEELGSLTSRALVEDLAKSAALVLCLEPATASGAVKTARKGTGEIEITARGVAAHAGVDHARGVNAIEELAHHILSVQRLTDYASGTTVNVGVVQGGTRRNVVPDEASAGVDFRVSTMDALEQLESWANGLQAVLPGARVSATVSLNRPPMPRDATMAQTFARARALAGQIGLSLAEGASGGGSDANFVSPLGIPLLDGLGAVGDGAHSEHEWVLASSLPERAALLAALILGWE